MTPYYEQDGITIYHGDCRDVLSVETADICITDPPYGIGYQSARGRTTFGRIVGDESVNADWLPMLRADTLYCFTRWDVLSDWRFDYRIDWAQGQRRAGVGQVGARHGRSEQVVGTLL